VSILDLSPPPPFSSPDTLKHGDVERPRFIFVQTDITNVEQVEDAVNRTVAWSKETGAELGGVINSAGIGNSELVGPCQCHILSGLFMIITSLFGLSDNKFKGQITLAGVVG
jgi:NAD(P)-dependent dehydrogenase (short-subunit alcohol dehydrogenase family)